MEFKTTSHVMRSAQAHTGVIYAWKQYAVELNMVLHHPFCDFTFHNFHNFHHVHNFHNSWCPSRDVWPWQSMTVHDSHRSQFEKLVLPVLPWKLENFTAWVQGVGDIGEPWGTQQKAIFWLTGWCDKVIQCVVDCQDSAYLTVQNSMNGHALSST